MKLRTRSMHKQVDRIYELKEYLRFHNRSFKKLTKLKSYMEWGTGPGSSDPVWDEMKNAVEDLEQFDCYMESLKERFNNLIELVSHGREDIYSRHVHSLLIGIQH